VVSLLNEVTCDDLALRAYPQRVRPFMNSGGKLQEEVQCIKSNESFSQQSGIDSEYGRQDNNNRIAKSKALLKTSPSVTYQRIMV